MDQKTMATKSTEVNPTVEVSKETSNPIVEGNFHEFQGSKAKMYDTYVNRAPQIAAALGNKAPIKS